MNFRDFLKKGEQAPNAEPENNEPQGTNEDPQGTNEPQGGEPQGDEGNKEE